MVTTDQVACGDSGNTEGMSGVECLPADIAVPCECGGCVPLAAFVVDGRPHHQAHCPHCDRLVFLSPPPRVSRVA
jgi:hypothetical protein